MSDLDKMWDFLMEWEGRTFEDDPDDPGGATKYGIDQRSHPSVNISALTEDAAKVIYQEEWNELVPPELEYPADIVFFNFCVNTGVRRATKFLQASMYIIADGIIGPMTRASIDGFDPVRLADSMILRADNFYKALNRPKYLDGWLNRNAALRKFIT